MYHRLEIHQFLKYFLGSGIAFLLDFGLLYVLTNYLGIYYLLGNSISYTIGALFSFGINKQYTFQNTHKNHIKQFFVFLVVSLINLVIANTLLYILVDYVHVHYLYAKIVATGIGFFVNFLGHKYITFKYFK